MWKNYSKNNSKIYGNLTSTWSHMLKEYDSRTEEKYWCKANKYNKITGLIKISYDTQTLNDKKLRPRKITSRVMLIYGSHDLHCKIKGTPQNYRQFLETTSRLHWIRPPGNSDIRGRSKVTRITITELKLFGKNRNRSPLQLAFG